MSTEPPPPFDPRDEFPPDSSDAFDTKERERRRLERILPQLIKRMLETGYEKISESPENVRQFVSDMKLPKEVLTLLLAQMDETKNGLYRVVAKEVRDFLGATNFAEEAARALTMLSFEIKTEVRFIPNDGRMGGPPKPDIKAKVRIKNDREQPAAGNEDDTEDDTQPEPEEDS